MFERPIEQDELKRSASATVRAAVRKGAGAAMAADPDAGLEEIVDGVCRELGRSETGWALAIAGGVLMCPDLIRAVESSPRDTRPSSGRVPHEDDRPEGDAT